MTFTGTTRPPVNDAVTDLCQYCLSVDCNFNVASSGQDVNVNVPQWTDAFNET